MIRGVVGEFRVDTGDPAADTVDVGAEFGEFAGIGDGGGAANELRVAAIEAGDALEAAKDVAEMAAEDAAIGVQFVDYDVAQILEDAGPASMVRQNAGVQHVRIGQDNVALLADGFARVAGRVTVVGEDADAGEVLIQEVGLVGVFRRIEEVVERRRFC